MKLVGDFRSKPLLEATSPLGAGLVLTVGQSSSLGGNITFELLKR